MLTENSQESWTEIVARIKELIISSFESKTTSLMMDINRMNSMRRMPGWNYCSYFILKEGLAFLHMSVGFYDEALRQYDELESSFYENLDNNRLSWFSGIGTTTIENGSFSLLDFSEVDYRQQILENKITNTISDEFISSCVFKLFQSAFLICENNFNLNTQTEFERLTLNANKAELLHESKKHLETLGVINGRLSKNYKKALYQLDYSTWASTELISKDFEGSGFEKDIESSPASTSNKDLILAEALETNDEQKQALTLSRELVELNPALDISLQELGQSGYRLIELSITNTSRFPIRVLDIISQSSDKFTIEICNSNLIGMTLSYNQTYSTQILMKLKDGEQVPDSQDDLTKNFKVVYSRFSRFLELLVVTKLYNLIKSSHKPEEKAQGDCSLLKDFKFLVNLICSHINATIRDQNFANTKKITFSNYIHEAIGLAYSYDNVKLKEKAIDVSVQVLNSINNSFILEEFELHFLTNTTFSNEQSDYYERTKKMMCGDYKFNDLFWTEEVKFSVDLGIDAKTKDPLLYAEASYDIKTSIDKLYVPSISTVSAHFFNELNQESNSEIQAFSMNYSVVGEPIYLKVDFKIKVDNIWSQNNVGAVNSKDKIDKSLLYISISFDHAEWLVSGALVQTIQLDRDNLTQKSLTNQYELIKEHSTRFCIVPLKAGYILPPTFECYICYNPKISNDTKEEYNGFKNIHTDLPSAENALSDYQNKLGEDGNKNPNNKKDDNTNNKMSLVTQNKQLSENQDNTYNFPVMDEETKLVKFPIYHKNSGKPIVVLSNQKFLNSYSVN
ncbi:hypothetical protein BB561_004770 [Smittium simulii]|uniref:TRAPPC10/Trs130 N-terminal domain-containing protein n=1 Tax=Smittium simulii TaxID=133385 RepID=A0A2T9YEB4_9FUNG|nr:hypothetical protein BB561_004770 [Smittium simulii]